MNLFPPQGDAPLDARRHVRPAAAIAIIVVATAALLHWQGRPTWCACGEWSIWSSDAWGPHNSQHLLDPYSITHILHGLILYAFLVLVASRLAFPWRLAVSVALESLWELFENSAFVIARYRNATAALGYEGDTVTNTLGDILSCAAGFWLASRLGLWKSLALFAGLELLLIVTIRDSLLLNVWMLVYPLDAIRIWQTGG